VTAEPRRVRIMRGPLYFGLSIRVGRLVWEPSLLAEGWACERNGDRERIYYAGRGRSRG
jgi:hypothetical protein